VNQERRTNIDDIVMIGTGTGTEKGKKRGRKVTKEKERVAENEFIFTLILI
jgi:hypothetical protein